MVIFSNTDFLILVEGQWGYGCCHSLIKNSYCTGEAGKHVAQAVAEAQTSATEEPEEQNKDAPTQQKSETEDDEMVAGKKRKYHSMRMSDTEVSEEQMEVYRQKRLRREDPMKDFVGKDFV